MKYCSMLSQSILVRQKMMAWSILCSLMAFTVYSPFRTLMASDHISKKAKRTHFCFRVHRINDYLGRNFLSALTCRISSGPGVVFGVDFIRLSKTKQGGNKNDFFVSVLSWECIFNLEAPYSSSNPILLHLHHTITKLWKKKNLHWGHTLPSTTFCDSFL